MPTKKPPHSHSSKSIIRHSLVIESIFGSEIQRDVALRTLTKLLATWKETVESAHAKNKITITDA
ncbi:MAG: hypothetical protein ABSB35_32585 [Bryobacteraceae bacterium]|jgi:hypothetical protein